MCDLIFSALKAQNQTASQQEQGTHNQGLENKKTKKSRITSLFKQTCLHEWATMQNSFTPEGISANYTSTSHIHQCLWSYLKVFMPL